MLYYKQARPRLIQISSEDDLHLLADPLLEDRFNPNEMLRMVRVAAGCICRCSKMRPRMGQVCHSASSLSSDMNIRYHDSVCHHSSKRLCCFLQHYVGHHI